MLLYYQICKIFRKMRRVLLRMVGEYGPGKGCICVENERHIVSIFSSIPHSSVGGVQDLRTGNRWFDPRLGQFSSRGLIIVIATRFIPLSPLYFVLTMAMWEISQWLGKSIVRSTSKRTAGKHG